MNAPGKAKLRDYRPADFESLYIIDQACYPPEIAYSRRELREYLGLPSADCLVAEMGGTLGGFALSASTGAKGHLVTIDVLPEYRHAGVGSTLLREAERRLAARGVTQVWLETATDNYAAIAFWKKHGYLTRGLIRNYYPGRLDAYSMHKWLCASAGKAPQR